MMRGTVYIVVDDQRASGEVLQIERYVLALPVQTEGEFIEGAQRRLERPRSCVEFGPIAPPWGTHG